MKRVLFGHKMGTGEMNSIKNQGIKKAQRTMNPLPQRLLTLAEGAHFLGRSVWSMRELVWKGSIPIVREGKRIFIDVVDLEGYIVKNKSTYV